MIVLVKLDFHGNNVSLRRKNLRNVVTIVMNKVIYYLKKKILMMDLLSARNVKL